MAVRLEKDLEVDPPPPKHRQRIFFIIAQAGISPIFKQPYHSVLSV